MPETDGLGEYPISVVKIFGPTIQGEGMYVGTLCTFIRTAGCDNRCAWCDTKYAQDIGVGYLKAYEDVAIEASRPNTEIVVITGGNPALQLHLGKLVKYLQQQCGKKVHIETQGTIWRECFRYADHITISPKPPSSANPLELDDLAEFIRQFKGNENFELKIVVFDHADLRYAIDIREYYRKIPMTFQVGTDIEVHKDQYTDELIKHYRELVHLCQEKPELRNIRILPQIHTLLYGDERGR